MLNLNDTEFAGVVYSYMRYNEKTDIYYYDDKAPEWYKTLFLNLHNKSFGYDGFRWPDDTFYEEFNTLFRILSDNPISSYLRSTELDERGQILSYGSVKYRDLVAQRMVKNDEVEFLTYQLWMWGMNRDWLVVEYLNSHFKKIDYMDSVFRHCQALRILDMMAHVEEIVLKMEETFGYEFWLVK